MRWRLRTRLGEDIAVVSRWDARREDAAKRVAPVSLRFELRNWLLGQDGFLQDQLLRMYREIHPLHSNLLGQSRHELHTSVLPALEEAFERGTLVAFKLPVPAAIPIPALPKDHTPPPEPVHPAKEQVNPIIDADKVVLVARPYTTAARLPVRLRTDKGFDGTGLLTRSKNNVDFFTSASGGTKLAFDGKDNQLAGGALGGGVTLFAEGTAASGAVGDVMLTLALSGGSKTIGPAATAAVTAVQVTLDICEPRAPGGGGGDPAPLPTAATAPGAGGAAPADKFYLGRPVP